MSRAVTSVPRQFIHKEKTIVKNIIVITGASSGPGVLAVVERVHAKLAPVAKLGSPLV